MHQRDEQPVCDAVLVGGGDPVPGVQGAEVQ